MSRWSTAIAAIVLLAGLIIAAMSFSQGGDSGGAEPPPGPAPDGQVWSPEHGHYH